MKPNRDIYRPTTDSGFEIYTPEGIELPAGVEIYINRERNSVKFFSGRRSKPDFFYRYHSSEAMFDKINRRLEEIIKIAEEKKARRAWVHDVKVGDIFRASWGYDQTNIDYYEVVKLVGKTMVEAREIEQEIEHTGDMSGSCIPKPGVFANDKTMRLKVLGGVDTTPYLKVSCCSHASRIEPIEVAPGVKVFKADSWTSYA